MPRVRNGIFVVLPRILARHPKALDAIRSIPKTLPVVVCVGDGGQETARELLALQMDVQAKLSDGTRELCVTIPHVDTGIPASHMSGESTIPFVYKDFDEIRILTTADKVKKKRKLFSFLRLVQVFGFQV